MLGACISYETSDARSQLQNPHGNTLFAEIHPGLTTSDWLLQRLRQPARVTEQGAGESLWRYDNVAVVDRRLRLLPLFEVSHTENHQQFFWFEIENNFIVDYWTTDPKAKAPADRVRLSGAIVQTQPALLVPSQQRSL